MESAKVRFWTNRLILFNINLMRERTNSPDRRVTKTVASLRLALTELILEKHYDAITVQDIIDRANVGRSTFYTHFRDKEDLLIGDWKKFLGLVGGAHRSRRSISGTPRSDGRVDDASQGLSCVLPGPCTIR